MSEPAGQRLGLGTFIGVFTPSILTILGVIMYLRIGWVVGNAGLVGTLAIVVLSNSITLITAFSVSALATNMRVGVGGAYYLISRSLGLEMGGAIGIPLYLSQTLSVTLYAFGLAESVRIIWPAAPVPWIAALIVLVVTLVAARSTMLALRLQIPIMALIALSLVSLFLGADWGSLEAPAFGGWEDGGFWMVFAVFFPAVTGLLAGVSLSGDLRDPARSIPRGVIGAVLLGFVIYLAVPIALASSAGADLLRQDHLVWNRVAVVPLFVMLGLWGAILSSAFGSILSAPRTLQALSADRLVPTFLGRTTAQGGEPVLGLRLSGALALVAVALGDLNSVATVVTMFFLTTYGTLNLVAGLEDLVGDISFRPRIRAPWWLCLLGALGCFVAMLAISPLAGAVALTAEAAIWFVLSRRVLRAAWGDLRTGIWNTLVRHALFRLRRARHEPRNWRPHILVFSPDLERDLEMVRVAAHFSQDRGIVTLATLLEGDGEDQSRAARLLAAHEALVEAEGLPVFCEVELVPQVPAGMLTVAQANGIAGLSSNTILFGWPRGQPAEGLPRLLALVRRLDGLQKCSLVYRPGHPPGHDARDIVVWWRGREHNGDLMLLLAWLLSLADDWRGSRVVLESVVASTEEVDPLRRRMEAMLEDTRIPAVTSVLVPAEGSSVSDLIRERSQAARLVFMGMALADPGGEEAYAAQLLALLDGLPPTLLVRNSGPFRGRLV